MRGEQEDATDVPSEQERSAREERTVNREAHAEEPALPSMVEVLVNRLRERMGAHSVRPSTQGDGSYDVQCPFHRKCDGSIWEAAGQPRYKCDQGRDVLNDTKKLTEWLLSDGMREPGEDHVDDEPPENERTVPAGHEEERRGAAPCRITLARAKNPPAEKFVVGNLLPFGKVSVLYGPSGGYKSTFLSQLAFKVAAGGGGSFLGMSMFDQVGGPVLVYSAEDTFEDWERKAAAQLAGDLMSEVDLERALERLEVIDISEGEARLTELVQVRFDLGNESITRRERHATPERLHIIQDANRLCARLIIIETTSRLVDDEDNASMAGLLAACGHIARETGAAVVLSHHPGKQAAKDNDSRAEAARGGGAFVNNSRCAISLFPADDVKVVTRVAPADRVNTGADVVLGHRKTTSSVLMQKPIRLVPCATAYGAVLRLPEEVASDPAQTAARKAQVEKMSRARDTQFAALYDVVERLRKCGPVSKNKLRPFGKELGVATRNVDALVDEALIADVVRAERRDKLGRILALGLGVRPGAVQPPRDQDQDGHD